MKKDQPDPKPRVTLRDIAKQVGVSHVTVSKALRNQGGSSEELKERIREKAEEMGYQPDPMLSALSHYRKTSTNKPVQSALAWINAWKDPEKLRGFIEFDEYWNGATFSANRFGYSLEEFKLKDIPVHRLEGILKARNIQGIIVPPADRLGGWEKLKKFDWSPFAVVRFGLSFPHLKTHYVTSAQMMNTMMAFERIQQLGYKRIGFVCEYSRDRVFGVGYYWAQKQIPQEQRIPELLLENEDTGTLQLDVFKKWLKKHQPDALITDSDDVMQMLQVLDYRVPEDIGLATTSIHDTAMDAGIDQRPYEIGRAAIRILTALIAERSFGLPGSCNETLVEGKWVDGSMMPLRK